MSKGRNPTSTNRSGQTRPVTQHAKLPPLKKPDGKAFGKVLNAAKDALLANSDCDEYWVTQLMGAIKHKTRDVQPLIAACRHALDMNDVRCGERWWRELSNAIAPYLRYQAHK